MLAILYHEKKERVVLISNYTQTLDIFQVRNASHRIHAGQSTAQIEICRS